MFDKIENIWYDDVNKEEMTKKKENLLTRKEDSENWHHFLDNRRTVQWNEQFSIETKIKKEVQSKGNVAHYLKFNESRRCRQWNYRKFIKSPVEEQNSSIGLSSCK